MGKLDGRREWQQGSDSGMRASASARHPSAHRQLPHRRRRHPPRCRVRLTRSAQARVPWPARARTAAAQWPGQRWSCRCRVGRRTGGAAAAVGEEERRMDGEAASWGQGRRSTRTSTSTACSGGSCSAAAVAAAAAAHVFGGEHVLQHLHHLLLVRHIADLPRPVLFCPGLVVGNHGGSRIRSA